MRAITGSSGGDQVEVVALRHSAQMPKRELVNGVLVHRIQDRFGKNESSPWSYLWSLLRFVIVSAKWLYNPWPVAQIRPCACPQHSGLSDLLRMACQAAWCTAHSRHSRHRPGVLCQQVWSPAAVAARAFIAMGREGFGERFRPSHPVEPPLQSASRHISPLARILMGCRILNCRKHRQFVRQRRAIGKHRFQVRNDEAARDRSRSALARPALLGRARAGGPAIAEASEIRA